jgi:hypothetical protein
VKASARRLLGLGARGARGSAIGLALAATGRLCRAVAVLLHCTLGCAGSSAHTLLLLLLLLLQLLLLLLLLLLVGSGVVGSSIILRGGGGLGARRSLLAGRRRRLGGAHTSGGGRLGISSISTIGAGLSIAGIVLSGCLCGGGGGIGLGLGGGRRCGLLLVALRGGLWLVALERSLCHLVL